MTLTNPPTLDGLPPPPPGKAGWPWTKEGPTLPERMADGRPWPRISIVTPNYNYAHFVEETIRSVLFQSYPNLEYLVIDDGSTDDSMAVIYKYEPWLAYCQTRPNCGQSCTINEGFSRATGEIWGWLNSDDVYQPGALAEVGQALANRQETMLVGAAVLTNGPDTLEGREDRRRPDWEEMAYDGRTFPQPSTFWTADLWQQSGPLTENLRYTMDFDLWLRMRPFAQDVLFTDALLAYERIHENQMSLKAVRRGEIEPVNGEKAHAVLQAASRRGERPWRWFLKSYGRRLRIAHQQRRYTLLWKSGFHRVVWRAARASGFRLI